MSELVNGLRTYRPDLDSYVFHSPQLAEQVNSWVKGVKDGSVSRALLLTGASGLGKTTLGIAACVKLGAVSQDIQEINCGTYRTLENARGLLDMLEYSPSHSDYRVLVLDECHQMVENAQQAFLTPLEKLPKSTIVVACTSQPQDLNPAFRRRFYELRLTEYDDDSILEILANLPIKLKPAMMATIVQMAGGNPGRAIALAESNPNTEDKEKQNALIKELLVIENFVASLFEADRKKILLHAKMLREENRKVFFEKVLQYLEGAWLVAGNLTPALPPKELAFIRDRVKGLQWPGLTPDQQAQKQQQYLGKVYNDMVKLSALSSYQLRAWAMTGLL
jgi:DNA polymerase III delta prime subunit